MSSRPSPVRPRGPLPARVYWARRAVVLGVPLALIVFFAQVLGGSSDGKDPATATRASAPVTTQAPAPAQGPTAAATGKQTKKGKQGNKQGKNKKKNKKAEPVLAQPRGTCMPSDIVATPDVKRIPGGSKVAIAINLRTLESEACTWRMSPQTFAVTITSGKDHIWSSRQCPASIKSEAVVVRRAVDAPIAVTWHARRSDDECSRYTDWARPGYYHVQAAALGGEATDVQFRLVAPQAPVVTQTVEPQPEGKGKNKGKKKNQPQDFKPGEAGEGSEG